MKLSLPISTFNAHPYLIAISEKRLHESMQKTLRPHNLFSNWGKIKAKQSESSSLSYVVASKVCCYIRTTIACKNRPHV